ncbi:MULTISPECIES: zf-HC2 domain-containing protein [unclassified Paenibacillus]|uniref:zf-HC2 domain-containing protein n=1 Tax=unclassified Paenibacillus TaxID=185978 RepID=UPI00210CEB26|nr:MULTISPECIES: zf-HC2 domain-containing protein [unclassified Paenibacillus]
MCQEVIELMQRYLDRDLEETEYRRMLGHLQQCPDCSELFERLVHVSTELESLPKIMPPYSLVDAILPEIERLEADAGGAAAGAGLAREEAAGRGAARADAAGAGPRPRAKRGEGSRSRMREWVSFPVLGGVVAAGLIFGFFAFQQDMTMNNKMAEEMASKSSQQFDMSQSLSAPAGSRAQDSADGGAEGSAAGSTMAAPESSGAQQPVAGDAPVPDKPRETASPPQADQRPGAGAKEPTTRPAAPKQPPAGEAKSPETGAGTPTSGFRNGAASPDAKITAPPEQGPALPDAANEQQGGSGGASGGQPDASLKAMPPQAGGAEGQTPAEDGSAADAKPEMGLMGAMEDPAAADARDANSKGLTEKPFGPAYKISEVPPAPKHELESKDGQYKAAVKDSQVWVYDKDGKEAYASKFDQWTGADRIELLEWNGLKLKYAVKMNEQTRTFEIDLQTKTEVEIKN